MDGAADDTGITNYWGLFTGKFGQPDLATFSDVVITYDTVFVTTYTVDDDGNTIDKYDSFKVVKSNQQSETSTTISKNSNRHFKVYPNPAETTITVSGLENIDKVGIYSLSGNLIKLIDNSNTINIADLNSGAYFIKVKTGEGIFIEQFIIK